VVTSYLHNLQVSITVRKSQCAWIFAGLYFTGCHCAGSHFVKQVSTQRCSSTHRQGGGYDCDALLFG